MPSSLFSISIFFVLLRETLEVSIIISVLLSFISRLTLSNTLHRKSLNRSVWIGTLSAFILSLAIGSVFITIWYLFGKNLFEDHESLFEGILFLIACVFISITALAFLNSMNLQEKLRDKFEKKLGEEQEIKKIQDGEDDGLSPRIKYLFFWIPFLSVLREGLESVLLLGGVSFAEPLSSMPLAAICGISLGIIIGIILHKLSGKLSLKWFFVIGSFILFLMAAGMFSKSISEFQEYTFKLSQPPSTEGEEEESEGPFEFDRSQMVWYFPSANEDKHLGFGILNALVGYQSVSTIGNVIGYCVYWIVIFISLVLSKRASRLESILKGDPEKTELDDVLGRDLK